jgi:hypothetical protein
MRTDVTEAYKVMIRRLYEAANAGDDEGVRCVTTTEYGAALVAGISRDRAQFGAPWLCRGKLRTWAALATRGKERLAARFDRLYLAPGADDAEREGAALRQAPGPRALPAPQRGVTDVSEPAPRREGRTVFADARPAPRRMPFGGTP